MRRARASVSATSVSALGQRGDVVGQALERHLGRQDAPAAAQLRIERHRQHDVRQAHRPAQEDRPHPLAVGQRRAERRHEADPLDVGGPHRLVAR